MARGVPAKKVNKAGEVVIRVSLSAIIAPEDTRAVVTGEVEIDMSVKKPDVMWLRSPEQLAVLGNRFREALRAIRDDIPRCHRIHLFYAGPTRGRHWPTDQPADEQVFQWLATLMQREANASETPPF